MSEPVVVNWRGLLRDLADAEYAWMREISAVRGCDLASLYRPAHAARYPPEDVREEGGA